MRDRSPDHRAGPTLSTDIETRRLHLPPEQTEGSSSSAALEDKSFKSAFLMEEISYQRSGEAPQGRR